MNFLIALLTGAASAFAFQPYALWPLMPVAFAILCELIARAPTLRRALLVGGGFALGQFCVGLNWIATAFTYQAAMPAWLGWVAVVLLSVYLAVYPAIAVGLAWRFGRRRRIALALGLAGAWAICEWLRGTMFTGYPWNPVGVVLADSSLIRASGAIGTYGLSGLIVLLGAALWLAWHREAKPVGAIVLAALVLGIAPPVPRPSDALLGMPPVRIVQPNIGQQDKWREGFGEVAARRLEGLSLQGTPSPSEILLWPEAAVTEPLEDQRRGAEPLVENVRLGAVSTLRADDVLMTGGLALLSRDGQTVTGAANSVFLLGPLGQKLGRYDKAHLVPYGEYLPMRPILSAIGLSRLAPGDLDFAAGPGPRTLTLPHGWGKVGLQLCYEIIFSGEVVDRADRPDFIFNPSNDAWFGRWGPPQHLAQARLRAAEEGMAVIRATPTGISALVAPTGRIVASLPWRQAGIIRAVVPEPLLGLTLFARLGNIIPLTLGFLMLGIAIALNRSRRYSAHI